MSFVKISTAKFIDKTTIEMESSKGIRNGATVSLIAGVATVAMGKAAVGKNNCVATVEFAKLDFDFEADYRIVVEGFFGGVAVSKSALVDDIEFIKKFECADTQELEYGAIVGKAKNATLFRLWAPLATAVTVNLYDDGTEGVARAQAKMTKRVVNGSWGGVWECEILEDLCGKYYTYSVNNAGTVTETIDPYAKACGANGVRGMVIDFNEVDPDGWEEDKHLYSISPLSADTPIVWEVHVKDFSASPDSGMRYKGKYLAFTEQNTVVPGRSDLKTGVNYLKDLGVTYVHLNPVYDFATIDESDLSIADDTKDNFNWGYDPQNYNIPEGSYATDPTRGEVRVNEFKQMVMSLHAAGIGVVMDVVYNHTYQTQGQALHDTVPYYYHRTNERGMLTDGTGCGNETASERAMFRKYIVDSILHWAREYHIDGFRFDLMGCHDRTTLAAVRAALDEMDDGRGRKILMYGEPWAGFGYQTPASYERRVRATSAHIDGTGKYTSNADNSLMSKMYGDHDGRDIATLPDRVAVFNDSGRDGLRGNLWDGQPGSGWANGNFGATGRVMKMLEGGSGSFGEGKPLGTGSRNVAYAAAHDNYTLWDQLAGKRHGGETPLFYDAPVEDRIRQCKLVSSAYLMSTGIAFMLAGEEMGRTKYGNENSYKSPIKLNQITWSRQATFSDLYEHYRALINNRKMYSATLFSYSKSTSPEFCYGTFTAETDACAGRIAFERGGLSLVLDAAALSGIVKIGSNTVVKF